jgi:hypothetical protein
MGTYQQNKEPQNCCFLAATLGKNDGFRARLGLFAVISLYLTARSAAAGLIAVGDGGVELFEPDLGRWRRRGRAN